MFSVPRQVFRASGLLMGSAAAVFSLAGCGNNYRPVVSAINPVGPSSQPTVYATVLSDPGGGKSGLITVVDVFGETNIANASVAPAPSYLALDPLGQAYVLHKNSVLVDSFTSAAGLMTNAVRQSSLAAGAGPTQINPGSGSGAVFITEPGLSQVSVLTGGAPPTARQDLPVPANPVYTVGLSSSPRSYTLSQGATPGTSIGTATAIENGTNNVISGSIPVGISPVYGIMTTDSRRAFVINNKGNGGATGTVSVINVQGNVLDREINVGVNPVWADLAPAVNEIAVLNAGTATTPGTLSIINVALCSQVALAGNAACDLTNPTDAVNFGTVLGTVPVGLGAVQVAVLQDLSKAYVANAADGTITVVDMNSMVATKTITLPKQLDAQGRATIASTLNWIGAVAGNPTGKVLVTASNSQDLYIIRTDTDALSATVPLQGTGVAVRLPQ